MTSKDKRKLTTKKVHFNALDDRATETYIHVDRYCCTVARLLAALKALLRFTRGAYLRWSTRAETCCLIVKKIIQFHQKSNTIMTTTTAVGSTIILTIIVEICGCLAECHCAKITKGTLGTNRLMIPLTS